MRFGGTESLEVFRCCIARCSRGIVGIVTSDSRQEITYEDGSKAMTWVGLTLVDKTPWCSRNPEVFGIVTEDFVKELENGTKEYL